MKQEVKTGSGLGFLSDGAKQYFDKKIKQVNKTMVWSLRILGGCKFMTALEIEATRQFYCDEQLEDVQVKFEHDDVVFYTDGCS